MGGSENDGCTSGDTAIARSVSGDGTGGFWGDGAGRVERGVGAKARAVGDCGGKRDSRVGE